jgi:hypothetical protein
MSMKIFGGLPKQFARLLAGIVLCCGLAFPNTILVSDVDRSRGESIVINENGADVSEYFAGVILLTVSDNTRQYFRDSLCVDLFTNIYIGSLYNTTVLTPSEVPGKNLSRVSWLIDNALLPTQGSYISLLPQADWVKSVPQGAGIQLAIWDIVHDNGDGFSSGSVQAAHGSTPTDPVALTWAQTYESLSLGKSDNSAYIYDNVNMGNGVPVQMLAGPEFTDGGPAPIPEPATMALSGAVLLALGFFARKRIHR